MLHIAKTFWRQFNPAKTNAKKYYLSFFQSVAGKEEDWHTYSSPHYHCEGRLL
jgi:hypothetical protein